MYWGTCVVLPQPVSPASRMIWWLRTASTICSLQAQQPLQVLFFCTEVTGMSIVHLCLLSSFTAPSSNIVTSQ